MPRTKQQTEQIRAESREKILITARRLFAEKGYDGCNVSDIAREAGMSQGNIYWYFPSKKEIFLAVLMDGFTLLGEVMSRAASGPGTAAEKMGAFLNDYFALMKDKGGEEFVSIVVTFIAQGGVEHFADFGISTRQIGAGYHQSLNAIFTQGQQEGVVTSGIDPNQLSMYFFALTNGLMLMYPEEWKEIPKETLHRTILRLVGMNPA
ncbi:MAG TPA: TetR/AcrR family transcriptional regulator [Anaerolineaceae bacterium]|nr:TetR/AcrR family transcriptional regulator [Anaerolineaceae bacterium]